MSNLDQAALEKRVKKLEYEVRELRALFLLAILGVFIHYISGQQSWGPVAVVFGVAGGLALIIKTFYNSVDRVTERLNQKTAERKMAAKQG